MSGLPGPSGSVSILVVDDRFEDRDLTSLVLRHDGHEVTEAENALDALALLEEVSFDLVVCDILMPGMDGYEFVHTLRQHPRLHDVPVVFVSASLDEHELADLEHVYGGCRFARKPVDPTELHAIVAAALDDPRPSVPEDVTEDHVARLRVLSAKLLHATERSERRRSELVRRARQQTAIAELGTYALGATDVADTLAWSAWLVRRTVGAAEVHLATVDRGFDCPFVAGSETEGTVGARIASVDLAVCADAVVSARGPVVVRDASGKSWLEAVADNSGALPAAIYPVGSTQQLLGVMVLVGKSEQPFNQDDLAFVATAANILATAVSRAREACEPARLAALVRASMDAIIGTDLDGTISSWNAAAERLYGIDAHEVIGRSFLGLVPVDERDDLVDVFARVAEGEVVAGLELGYRRSDGDTVDLELTASPVTVGDGSAVGAMMVIRDLTERRRSEDECRSLTQQLQHAQRLEAIGRLAGGVAHDFNNLVLVISGFSSMALERMDPDDELRGPIEEVRLAAERAATLTRQLLAFSHVQVMETRPLDLNELVTGATGMIGRLIGEDIELVIRLDPNLGRIVADPGHIEQVIVNLAVNARDAMPNGGRLIVETADVAVDEYYVGTHAVPDVAGRYVRLTVTDTGMGMDEETKARIFEPFFTTKPVGTGTGLGLSTVHGIVTQSGGFVNAYSEVDHGTTLRVYLPVVDAPVDDRVRTFDAAVVRGSGAILLVEDDEAVRHVVGQMLESTGYVVHATDDADEAERIVRDVDIELVLTDMVMPRANGLELVERLRSLRPAMRFVVMSGYSEQLVRMAQEDRRDLVFLEKPFTRTHLTETITSILQGGAPAVDRSPDANP